MSGLYNLVHGTNPFAPILLAMLGISANNVPRFRDCWWTGTEIAIHTRTGGGNRYYYEDEKTCRENYPDDFKDDSPPSGPWNDDLRALPTFLRDEDDDYDCTYATFYFGVPEKLKWAIPHIQAQTDSPSARWGSFIERMKDPAHADDPDVKRALGAMEPIFEKINSELKAD